MEEKEFTILCKNCARELEGSENLVCPGCRRAWEQPPVLATV